MAVEQKRGCGYRKVGGLYLCGSGISTDCDRLPFPLEYCPTCGAGIKFTRGFTWIDWEEFAGKHEDCSDSPECSICVPSVHKQPYGLLWVGESFYTPQSFIKEALGMGVSKRIPFIPKELVLNETVILLAHKKGITEEVLSIGEEDYEYHEAIFFAFTPRAIEMLVYESELTDEKVDELLKRGITPITIPNDDIDHSSSDNITTAYDPETKTFSKVLLEE